MTRAEIVNMMANFFTLSYATVSGKTLQQWLVFFDLSYVYPIQALKPGSDELYKAVEALLMLKDFPFQELPND